MDLKDRQDPDRKLTEEDLTVRIRVADVTKKEHTI